MGLRSAARLAPSPACAARPAQALPAHRGVPHLAVGRIVSDLIRSETIPRSLPAHLPCAGQRLAHAGPKQAPAIGS